MVTTNPLHPRANMKNLPISNWSKISNECLHIHNEKTKMVQYRAKVINRNILLMLFLIGFNLKTLTGQTCVNSLPEPKLELTVDPSTLTIGSNSFGLNYVLPWKRSFGTPHHFKIDENQTNGIYCSGFFSQPGIIKNCFYAATEFVTIIPPENSYWGEWIEGVHTNYDFIAAPYVYYCINYDLERFDCLNPNQHPISDDVTFYFRAGNGITDIGTTPSPGIPWPVPGGTNIENIGQVAVNSIGNYTGTIDNFIPSMNLSQFQLYIKLNNPKPQIESAYITVNNVEICCKTSAIQTISANLPSGVNCGLNYNLSSTIANDGCNKDETYTWYIKDGNGNVVDSISGEDITYTFLNEGKHEVCFRYVDCNGCRGEECLELNVNDCFCEPPSGFTLINARGGVALQDIIGIQSNNNTVSNPNWLVTGELIIDISTNFAGGTILMDDGAKITIDPGILCRINGTEFRAGCNNMWRGIFYSGAGRYSIVGATIKDAETALNISGSAQINLLNSNFDRNWVSVWANDAGLPLFACEGNTFEYTSGMLAPYTGQLYYNAERSHAGIFGINVGEMRVNGSLNRNFFRDMWNGIILDRSSLICINNELTDFSGYTTQFGNFTSRGLPIKVSLGNTIDIRGNVIKNGHHGISLIDNNFSNINIEANDEISGFLNSNVSIASQSNAILIRGGILPTINIFNNEFILNNYRGILQENLSFPNTINIEANEISSIVDGIRINTSPAFSGGNIQHNKINIDNNSSYSVNPTGVFLKSSPFYTLSDNIINHNTILSNQSNYGHLGISMVESGIAGLYDNVVNGLDGTSKTDCYTLVSSGITNLICNKADIGRQGFSFSNIPFTTFGSINFETNKMVNIGGTTSGSSNGGLIVSNSTLGPQFWKGNIWLGGTPKAVASNLSNPLQSSFKYNDDLSTMPIEYAGGNWIPTYAIPVGILNNWFQLDDANPNETCVEQEPQAFTLPTASQLEGVVNGDVLNNDYYNQNLWTAQLQLLLLLQNNPSYLIQSNTLNQFYNGNSAINQYYNFDKLLDNLAEPTPSEKTQLVNYNSQLNTYQSELNTLVSQVNDNNFQSILVPIVNKSAQIESTKSLINSLNLTLYNRSVSNANNLKQDLNTLPEPYVFCAEFKEVFDARLDLFLQSEDYVRTNHGTLLSTIAELCPFEIGNPVFEARYLCDQLDISYSVDDECSNNRISDINEIENNKLKLYPNPVRDILSIKSNEGILKVAINDLNGQLLYSKIENGINIDKNINVSHFRAGMYIITVFNTVGKQNTYKFIKE